MRREADRIVVLKKRVRDTQKCIDKLTDRVVKVKGRVDQIEMKLGKTGGLFE